MHDFISFPELTDSQMELYYFESPHKQITEDFTATVIKVHDGDTVTLRADFRNFDFPMRFLDINAPELKDRGGDESKEFLRNMIEGKEIDVIINKANRVEKWGRLLGWPVFQGINLCEEMVFRGFATPFDLRNEGQISPIEKILKEGGVTLQV